MKKPATFFAWLTPTQMIDGLALGETTPGPLIIVVAFVAFVGLTYLSVLSRPENSRFPIRELERWSSRVGAFVESISVRNTFLPAQKNVTSQHREC